MSVVHVCVCMANDHTGENGVHLDVCKPCVACHDLLNGGIVVMGNTLNVLQQPPLLQPVDLVAESLALHALQCAQVVTLCDDHLLPIDLLHALLEHCLLMHNLAALNIHCSEGAHAGLVPSVPGAINTEILKLPLSTLVPVHHQLLLLCLCSPDAFLPDHLLYFPMSCCGKVGEAHVHMSLHVDFMANTINCSCRY